MLQQTGPATSKISEMISYVIPILNICNKSNLLPFQPNFWAFNNKKINWHSSNIKSRRIRYSLFKNSYFPSVTLGLVVHCKPSLMFAYDIEKKYEIPFQNLILINLQVFLECDGITCNSYQQILKNLKNHAFDRNATVGLAVYWFGSWTQVLHVGLMSLLRILDLEYLSCILVAIPGPKILVKLFGKL